MSKSDACHAFKHALEYLSTCEQIPHDDTLLHKLSDVLHNRITTAEEMTRSDIKSFLKTVVTRKTDPRIIVFALKLVHSLALKGCLYSEISELVTELFCHIKISYMDELMVRTSLFQTLQAAFHQDKQCTLFAKFPEFFSEALAALCKSENIYLSKEARVLVEVTVREGVQSQNICDAHRKWIEEFVLKLTQSVNHHIECSERMKEPTEEEFLTQGLQIVNRLHTSLSGSILSELVKPEFLSRLLLIYGFASDRINTEILHYIDCALRNCSAEQTKNIMETVRLLMERNKINSSQKLGCILLSADERFLTEDDKVMVNDLIMLPLLIITNTDVSALKINDGFTEAFLCDSRQFGKCLNWTLERISSIKQQPHTTHSILFSCIELSFQDHENSNYNKILKQRKVQLKLLDCAANIITNSYPVLPGEATQRMWVSLKSIMQNICVDSAIYSKCTAALLELCKSPGWSNNSGELTELLKKNLCSTQWEIRDSTLEFIGDLITSEKGRAAPLDKTNSLCHTVWSCSQDGESYVRATVLLTLAKIMESRQLMTMESRQLMSLNGDNEESILTKVLDMLLNDTEAFVRRAAVNFLISYQKHHELSENEQNSLQNAFLKAYSDFDWEVKFNTLTFWEHIVQKELEQTPMDESEPLDRQNDRSQEGPPLQLSNNHTSGVEHDPRFGHLVQTSCIKCLMLLSRDYEPKVSFKALTILRDLKVHFCDENSLESSKNQESPDAEISEEKSSSSTEMQRQHSDGWSDDTLNLDNISLNNLECLAYLRKTDFDFLLKNHKGLGYDYINNPYSLIEDIVGARHEDKDEDDENMIDCY